MTQVPEQADRIMVVDDNSHNLALLESILVERGFRVMLFPNGERALRAAERNPPDLVLLDIMMPELDGFEVCRRMKAIATLKEIPIIFISALSDVDNKIRAFAEGGVDYITKPIDEQEVLARVRTQLSLRKAWRQLQLHRDHLEELVTARTAELRREHARLRNVVEGVGAATWESNIATGEVEIDDRWYEMLGRPVPEQLTLGDDQVMALMHPEDVPLVRAALDETLAGHRDFFEIDFRMQHASGEWRWMRARGSVIEREPGGAPLIMAGNTIDIHERKLSEEKLHVSQARYRAMVENLPMTVCRWRPDTTILYANREYCEKVAGRDDIVGTPWIRFVPEDARQQVLQTYSELAAAPRLLSYEHQVGTRDGGTHWYYWVDIPILGPEGEVMEFQSVGIDITSRKAAEQDLLVQAEKLERTVLGTVNTIARMVDLKDPYTAGHELRVAQLARAIGSELGLDEHACHGLEVASRIHDIGKLTLPAELLSKPGKLSDIEMSLVRTHAEQGYLILRDIDFDWPVAEIVRQHHERIDGSGYPRGLKGNEIALEARILAVADVVESMASHRPYRPALGIDVALEEIETKAGLLYDEKVVRACLKIIREDGWQFSDG